MPQPGRHEKLTGQLYPFSDCYLLFSIMNTTLLTPANVAMHVGHQIIFKRKSGEYIIKTILDISTSGKSIRIDCPDLGNNLEITSRNVYMILG